MAVISMKNLLEAGVHFGHKTEKLHPKMKSYVYMVRNGIHVIDLQRASQMIDTAHKELRTIVDEGGKVLFVGTKKQAQEAVKEQAKRCGMFYVNSRWLGGTLTNMKTIRKSIDKLKDIESFEESEESKTLTKKELSVMSRKRDKLKRNLDGIKDMEMLPDAMFIIDMQKDHVAIDEARKLGIPIFAMVDTNCNPSLVDFPMPSNDDAIRSISLITKMIADTVLESAKETEQVVAKEGEGEESKVEKEEPKEEVK